MKVAINTGGGDAPGLNAVIRAVVIAASQRDWEVYGIREGYNGIIESDRFPDGGIIQLDRKSVSGITHLGGTILGTTNKSNPLEYPVQQDDGSWKTVDRCDEIISVLKSEGFDALIAIGGDGSLSVAHEIGKRGDIPVIGVPKTIDNDLKHTQATFGFDTAVGFATECIDRLHSTAESHRRIMVVEVMGRYAGWIALESGLAAGADAILIPEIPYEIDKVARKMKDRIERGAHFSIVVVAEGAREKEGSRVVKDKEIGRAERLGGIGEEIAAELQEITGQEARCVVLGHLLRGGTPSARDRMLSLRFGAAAIRALEEGRKHVMVALKPPYVDYVALEEVAHAMKLVPVDSDTIATARDMGISFGD